MKEHKIVYQFTSADTCFGCNDGPAEGAGVRAFLTEDGYVVCKTKTKECHQGFPNVTHGGILSTYFDEVLWFATLVEDPDVSAMTVEMNIKYKKPVPTGTEIRIIAKPAVIEGRHYHVEGYILLPDGEVAVTAKTHYIALKKNDEHAKDEHIRSRSVIRDFEMKSIEF